MIRRFIKMNSLDDTIVMIKRANEVAGDVLVYHGRYIIDGKSALGVLSLDLRAGATIEYPAEAT